jgi:hypothetical protein
MKMTVTSNVNLIPKFHGGEFSPDYAEDTGIEYSETPTTNYN